MNEKIKLALIYGSNRENRFCDTVANWAINQIGKSDEFDLTTIDPAKMNLPRQIGKESNADLSDFRKRVREAEAFMIVVPEYNHGYPSALKFLIDAEYEGWRAKPVSFVSYGGISGGIRAVEQLRQVFCELHAMTVRDSVHLPNAWRQFDKDGNIVKPQVPEKMFSDTVRQLKWWANALREARKSEPYMTATV
ncbi:MAG TPA: NAD(P)H-dependent oxidoreductase [Pyrinomonadaceae bacterium]|jgi:NAD(P)H-dependent FMN reductase